MPAQGHPAVFRQGQLAFGRIQKAPNHVAAFDAKGNQIGIIFETASPLDTPRLMKQLVRITRERFQDEDIHPLLMVNSKRIATPSRNICRSWWNSADWRSTERAGGHTTRPTKKPN
ncbi:MAG: hypothetical protein V2I40_05925, partial [Desulfobacteraceae bacterium]|nr:hypothetical protein [Desulfobacteraceae bacterium]